MSIIRIVLVYLCLLSTPGFAQTNDQVIFINGTGFTLKRAPGLTEFYSFKGLDRNELFRLYAYYGDDSKGLVIYFLNDKQYGFLPGETSEKTIDALLSELQTTELIRDRKINVAQEKEFLKQHPLPKGYQPPQQAHFY